jgi:hypothetical protein
MKLDKLIEINQKANAALDGYIEHYGYGEKADKFKAVAHPLVEIVAITNFWIEQHSKDIEIMEVK